MIYRILAEGVLIAHLAFVLFAAFGGLLILRWRPAIFIHVPAVVWAFLVQWFQWICPLTPFEIRFRELAGQSGYSGGFLENYLSSVLYLNLGRWLHVTLAFGVILLNFMIYRYVFKYWRISNS